jgi:hypothetical protein
LRPRKESSDLAAMIGAAITKQAINVFAYIDASAR